MQQIRKSHGLTQEKLAELMEVSTRYISEVEQDRVKPSYEVIVRFCNAFKIGLDEVFSQYLEKTQKEPVSFEMSGFNELKPEDKRTIEHLITFFNSSKC